jgi:hypothetical protein
MQGTHVITGRDRRGTVMQAIFADGFRKSGGVNVTKYSQGSFERRPDACEPALAEVLKECVRRGRELAAAVRFSDPGTRFMSVFASTRDKAGPSRAGQLTRTRVLRTTI